MEIINLGSKSSLVTSIIAELRDVVVQKNRFLFRNNIQKLGQIMAYEISKILPVRTLEVTTPLGTKKMQVPLDNIVIASILRAGLPLHDGLLSYFDKAENIFIAAYREYYSETEFNIKFDYFAGPDVQNKILILADPMLATAASIIKAYQKIVEMQAPLQTHIVNVIAAEPGIENLKKVLRDKDVKIWTCAIDSELNNHGYIVPGLGDAGDLAFGLK